MGRGELLFVPDSIVGAPFLGVDDEGDGGGGGTSDVEAMVWCICRTAYVIRILFC